MAERKTQPKPRFPQGYEEDPSTLTAGRYGTKEMVEIWGPEKTFEYILRVQGQAALTLSFLHSDVISSDIAREIYEKANLKYVSAARIRELEKKKGHDVIAINIALEEVVSEGAKPHVGQLKTSADATQPAKALQLKNSLEVIADSAENLCDILVEKALEWKNIPHMDGTHLYDALPTVAGRPLVHYVEMLQTGLELLNFVYTHSIIGKWADATGNHHSAAALGINGIELQRVYCNRLGIGYMDAPAQVPGLEFEADIIYSISRLAETMNNIARYIAWGRSDDVNIFVNANPKRKKGSAAMPHKDAKNGNPDVEEQYMSIRRYLMGNLVTSMANCEMPYARDLSASANMRINFEDSFKFLDHGIRNLANTVYWIGLREERSKERVLRSYGAVTSEQVLAYLTDKRKTPYPLPALSRSEAHDILGKLATYAWENKTPFGEVLRKTPEVSLRLSNETIEKITNPLEYIGQSKEIIDIVANKYYRKKTL